MVFNKVLFIIIFNLWKSKCIESRKFDIRMEVQMFNIFEMIIKESYFVVMENVRIVELFYFV